MERKGGTGPVEMRWGLHVTLAARWLDPAANQGKCFDTAMKEITLPKYETGGSYQRYLPGNVERFCEYWGRGC